MEGSLEDLLHEAYHLRSKGDYGAGLLALQGAASKGVLAAMYELGMAFRNGGWTLEASNKEAWSWLEKCVQKGHMGAALEIHLDKVREEDILASENDLWMGMCMFLRAKTPEQRSEAVARLERAAYRTNDSIAQYWAGISLQQLQQQQQNSDARIWLEKSAHQGYSMAQWKLGQILFEKDPERAHILLYQSSIQGCGASYELLARSYQKKGDMKSASFWQLKQGGTSPFAVRIVLMAHKRESEVRMIVRFPTKNLIVMITCN